MKNEKIKAINEEYEARKREVIELKTHETFYNTNKME